MVTRKTNRESITTIKLEKETKARLSRLKEHERETYEQVIRKILFILNKVRKNSESGNRLLSRIDRNIKRKLIHNKKQKEHEAKELNQTKESPKTESSTQ